MGLIQNRENDNENIARQMLELGLDPDQVSQITGISKEKLEELLGTETKS